MSAISLKVSSLFFFITSNLFVIRFLASGFSILKDKSSSSSRILFIPILSARGAYISIVSLDILIFLLSSVTDCKVLMLCNLSASFTKRTLISFEVASISFLKFSALEFSFALSSSAEIFVTPSTKSATSNPNSFFTDSYVAFVSSMVSCNNPVTIVALSNFNSVKMSATATGCII